LFLFFGPFNHKLFSLVLFCRGRTVFFPFSPLLPLDTTTGNTLFPMVPFPRPCIQINFFSKREEVVFLPSRKPYFWKLFFSTTVFSPGICKVAFFRNVSPNPLSSPQVESRPKRTPLLDEIPRIGSQQYINIFPRTS